MKHLYETPRVEMEIFSAMDVTTTSPGLLGGLINQGSGDENSGLHIDIDDFFGST